MRSMFAICKFKSPRPPGSSDATTNFASQGFEGSVAAM